MEEKELEENKRLKRMIAMLGKTLEYFANMSEFLQEGLVVQAKTAQEVQAQRVKALMIQPYLNAKEVLTDEVREIMREVENDNG